MLGCSVLMFVSIWCEPVGFSLCHCVLVGRLCFAAAHVWPGLVLGSMVCLPAACSWQLIVRVTDWCSVEVFVKQQRGCQQRVCQQFGFADRLCLSAACLSHQTAGVNHQLAAANRVAFLHSAAACD